MEKAILIITLCLINWSFSFAVVEFDTATVKVENNLPKIKWSTKSQMDSDHFVIYRSYDSINYENIGRVRSDGNSNSFQTYEIVDTNFTITARKVYYRITEVSFDGSMDQYPSILSLDSTQLSVIDVGDKSLFVHPNPARDYTYVKYDFFSSPYKDFHVGVYDMTGKMVLKQNLKNTTQNKDKVYTDRIVSGIYTCVLYGDNKMLDKVKFMVIE